MHLWIVSASAFLTCGPITTLSSLRNLLILHENKHILDPVSLGMKARGSLDMSFADKHEAEVQLLKTTGRLRSGFTEDVS